MAKTPLIFLDFKPINNLALRLYGLSDWNWILGSYDLSQLQQYTRNAIEQLSLSLSAMGAHRKTFVAARHPQVDRLIKLVDPQINVMISPESVRPKMKFSPEEAIAAFEEVNLSPGTLIEIRYLAHLMSPQIRGWAKARGLVIFYNQIHQTDISQFRGPYQNNLPRLYQDLFSQGSDLWVQTNTPRELRDFIDTLFHP